MTPACSVIDATAFRVAAICATLTQGSDARPVSVATLGWFV
jgi:hypothetical protein